MKKLFFYVLAITLVLGISTGFDTEAGSHKSKQKLDDSGMYMCPMHKMMMKNMMSTEVVATQDGGIVLIRGNKLVKHDKDMNQVKEVEITMDMEKIETMLQEQIKDCPMRKRMMEAGGMMHGEGMHKKMMKRQQPE